MKMVVVVDDEDGCGGDDEDGCGGDDEDGCGGG